MEIERELAEWKSDAPKVIEDLLAAETYWREVVKNAELDSDGRCHFCRIEQPRIAPGHKPDCVWLLAQEV